MEYRRTEIRAGIFLLISFVIVVVMIFAVSDIQSLFKKKKELKVLFTVSDGIEKNAPVRYSGMKIGKVESVRVAPEHGDKIELVLSVYRDTVLKEDTKAAVKTLGLVGGKYVELSGGTPEARTLGEAAMIKGEESLKMEDLTRIGIDVAHKLQNIAANLEKMLGDPATSQSLKGTILNVQELTGNLRTITSGKDEMAQGLKNVPELVKKLDESVNNLRAIAEKTDKFMGDNKANIDATMGNVKEITGNLKELTDELKKSPWKLIRKP